MKSKTTFNKLLNICLEEEGFDQLHTELVSLEFEIKKTGKFDKGINEIMEAIDIYADTLPEETKRLIDNIFEDYLENQ